MEFLLESEKKSLLRQIMALAASARGIAQRVLLAHRAFLLFRNTNAVSTGSKKTLHLISK
jgi:hypothetical protein